jgi:hypothetical protein
MAASANSSSASSSDGGSSDGGDNSMITTVKALIPQQCTNKPTGDTTDDWHSMPKQAQACHVNMLLLLKPVATP